LKDASSETDLGFRTHTTERGIRNGSLLIGILEKDHKIVTGGRVMKRMVAWIFALLVVVALIPTANAAERCTTASLKGNYGFTASGYFPNGAGNAPIVATGVTTLDGEGNVTATVTASFNGDVQTFPYTGTYSVNPDCTGSVTATPGSGLANFSIVVVRGGAEILGMDSDPGNTWTIDFKKTS
jgi:hypothetical protein